MAHYDGLMSALSSSATGSSGLSHAWHTAADAAALARDLALTVAGLLRAGIAERGQALLIVSGGSTPLPFFEALAQQLLPWAQVTITLADERWVPATHPDSNERLVRAHLLQGHAAPARFVPLFNGAASPQAAQAALDAVLRSLPWPADAVVLGMGGDGHTASLFPHAAELHQALDLDDAGRCIAVGAPSAPNVPVPRISLTARALLDARQVLIHVTGAAKVELLRQAMQPGPVAEWPIRLALHQQQAPCHIFQA
ncbi:MAG TPA: 6-phosphogluconolactonase [Aquabacterium sp.]|nr:6-phosphogluconolactonase [Aquabacterium sp.]